LIGRRAADPEGEQLLAQTLTILPKIVALKERARRAGAAVIYVNDNFGRWRSDFSAQVEHCLHDGVLGQPIAEQLRPEAEDYFVLKPKHSGFFCTSLDILLDYLGVKTVILAGIAGNICVQFTAHDAFLRDLHLIVPSDCVASNTPEENEQALGQMRTVLKADVRASAEIDWAKLT
jgi:nicotinamidase-related amidase